MGFNPGDVGHLAEHDRVASVLSAHDSELAGRLSQTALETRYGTTMHAPQYGVVGDGTTDDLAALQALLDSAAAFGASVTLEAGSTVLVDSTVNVPSGTRLNLNGGTIKRGPTGSGVMLQLLDKSNIKIGGGRLDGNKAAYAPVTEWRHNINLDNSHNITLRDLDSDNSKGDGIYVGGTVTHCTNIDLFNVGGDNNHRQGLTIVGVDGFTATSSRFTGTNGTAPAAGVDVEPNLDTTVCKNIRFVGCTMTGNAGYGFLVALRATRTAVQGDITLTACTIDDNVGPGIRLTESDGFKMIGGSLVGNFQGLLHDTNTARDTKLIGVSAKRNDQHGVSVLGVYSDLLISDCTFDANGQTTVGDGLNIAPSATSTNLRMIGNRSGGAPQRNGVTFGANCSGVMMIGNVYVGNTGAARSGTSVITLDLDSAGKRTITGAKGGNVALASLLTQLAGLGLITDSTTA